MKNGIARSVECPSKASKIVAKSNLLLISTALWEDASAEYLEFYVFEYISATEIIIGFD